MSARLANTRIPAPKRFSRKWFYAALRSLGWVAVITFLIWVYADLHFTETEQVRVRLVIHTASAGNSMVVLGPSEVTVMFRVKGNKHSINRLKGRRIMYDAARNLDKGTHDLDVAELLAGLDELRAAPMEIIAVDEPEKITIQVDPTEPFRNVPVEPEYTGGEPSDKAVIKPDKVDLFVPLSRKPPDMQAPGSLAVRVDLTGVKQGESIERRLPVQPPPRLVGAIIRPSSVMVALKVAETPAERILTVPVRVQSPTEWLVDDTWARYKLDKKDALEWTKPITITGNRIDLDKVRPEDVRAYIVLTEDSKQPVESWLSGKVHVELPKGLNVRALTVTPVSYRLRKRSAAPPPP